MKIEKFQKLKNGMYKLKLKDGNEIKIYEDLILKYNLLIHKTITEELFIKIEKENMDYECYYTSLKYLKTKKRSKKEILEYLKKQNYLIESIDKTINKLEHQGYLNDKDYAISFLQEQLILTLNGPNKIKEILRQKGISEDTIEIVLKNFTIDKMEEKIDKIINKKVKSNHNKSKNVLKQKIKMDLINQGYPIGLIIEKTNNINYVNEDELRKKEQEKLYKKLIKKYSGKELEYKVKQKMYEKGFRYDE